MFPGVAHKFQAEKHKFPVRKHMFLGLKHKLLICIKKLQKNHQKQYKESFP